MSFEWDVEKEQANIKKHGISFTTAMRVFNDYYRIEKYDAKHSAAEERFITIGEVNGTYMVVMVVYTEREEATRIISARLANKHERREYNDYKKKFR